jgi:hypothetical protein
MIGTQSRVRKATVVAQAPTAVDRGSLPLLQERPERTPGERAALGVLAAAVVCLPVLVPSGPMNIAPVDLLIALGVGLTVFWAGNNAVVLRFPYSLAMTLFLVGGAIGALVGPFPGTGLSALVQDLVLLVWVAALVNLARRPENLRVLLAAWCYGAVAWTILLVFALVGRIGFISGVTPREGSRISLMFGDPNFAGNYFFISIMLVWATGIPRHRTARIFTYLALLIAMVMTGSNGAVSALVVGSVIVAAVTIYRRAGLVQAVGGVAAIVVTGALLSSVVSFSALREAAARSSYATLRDGIGRSSSSVEQRDLLLHENILLYYQGTLLGSGPTSTKPRLVAAQSLFPKEAHSDYWASLVERGLIGFLGLMVLIGTIAARSWYVLTRPRAPAFVQAVPRPEGLVAAAIGCLLAGTVVFEALHVRHVWFVYAMVAALSIWGTDDA